MKSSFGRPLVATVGMCALLATSTVAVGSASAAPTAPVGNQVVVDTTNMNYQVQGGVRPGIVSITWHNRDDDLHMMSMGRLKAGVTQQQLKAAAGKGDKALGALLLDSPDTTYGAPALLSAGETETVTTTLQSGNYALICFVMGKDHMTHAAMGMVGILKVAGATSNQAPSSSGIIAVGDNGIRWPNHFTGHGTYLVKDTGHKPHSLSLARLDRGVPLLQFAGSVNNALQSGSQPQGGKLVSGIDSLSPGQSAWITLDLTDGHYGYVSPTDISGPQLPKQAGEFDLGGTGTPTSSPTATPTASGPVVVTDGPMRSQRAGTNWSLVSWLSVAGAAVIASGAGLRRRVQRR
ncbi:cupredoxin domain-containing protein [Calidifontibacter terrae]